MRVRVIYSVWGADGFDEPLHGGEHDLEDLTDEQARSVAGGVAGGALELVDTTPEDIEMIHPHIQSQEDGEAAYAAAHESGEWREGNLQAFVAVARDRLADPEFQTEKYAGRREKLQRDLDEALDALDVGADDVAPAGSVLDETSGS